VQRICFVLQVKPDRLQEYIERHRQVWPEMQAALRETGWNNYSLSFARTACWSAISKPKTSSAPAPA
jgi:L-rhamnose mutarotase